MRKRPTFYELHRAGDLLLISVGFTGSVSGTHKVFLGGVYICVFYSAWQERIGRTGSFPRDDFSRKMRNFTRGPLLCLYSEWISCSSDLPRHSAMLANVLLTRRSK